MAWFLPRMLFAAVMAALGAVAGSVIGWGSDTVVVLTVLGAAVGASMSAFIDRMKGYRLMKWLRGDRLKPAPRDPAFWGELGFRVERALRLSQRQTERERQNVRDFLEAIEASPNGVLLLDGNDQIEWCNRAAAEHFGLDPVRDLRQRVTNLVRDPIFVQYLASEPDAAGVTMSARIGRETLSVQIRPYGEGKKLVLSTDITERERTEAMRRDFVANVSHEIRTPLTVLAGFVETLASVPMNEHDRARVLALMEQQTGRMQALVSDLLTLAQLEGSPRPSHDSWTALADLLADARAQAQVLSGDRHRLEICTGAGLSLSGNPVELLSAIVNLLSNAIRYTPAGGSIAVTWRLRADGCGELAVEDNGPGIAREHLARLTERFYRVDGSRSRETGGTGLGLSIVKHVMQRHGGEIVIDSELGRGSTFRLVFPAVRVREDKGAPQASAEVAPSGTDDVLGLVGDAPVDRHQLAGLPVAALRGHQPPPR